ncbi:hypothetical protein AKN92_11585 [Thiopseudomonas alkaliphila]|uniref:Uncharacterized protein n=1 Tax=Thiopseudomonas alkaliphila TaxID=1697053 RepID=A0A0K1XH23_9GAMM|nr:hypothetical protein [Thiopseudomonas alkaliphila]AKX52044.1 hypothetical protein AKN92_11585 [Thiopseudomonas alkaliphila]AKX60482.1 hypothetical protein AKN88_11510 [Thiopseudomonas alkaliphila]
MLFTVYDKRTGKVLTSGRVPEEWIKYQVPDENADIIIGESAQDVDYVINGVIVERPVMGISLKETILEGVPIGAKVYVDGEFTGICESGYVEFNKSTQDSYQIKFSLFPYLDSEITV